MLRLCTGQVNVSFRHGSTRDRSRFICSYHRRPSRIITCRLMHGLVVFFFACAWMCTLPCLQNRFTFASAASIFSERSRLTTAVCNRTQGRTQSMKAADVQTSCSFGMCHRLSYAKTPKVNCAARRGKQKRGLSRSKNNGAGEGQLQSLLGLPFSLVVPLFSCKVCICRDIQDIAHERV